MSERADATTTLREKESEVSSWQCVIRVQDRETGEKRRWSPPSWQGVALSLPARVAMFSLCLAYLSDLRRGLAMLQWHAFITAIRLGYTYFVFRSRFGCCSGAAGSSSLVVKGITYGEGWGAIRVC